MADKKISELSTASVINNSDNIELSQDTGNGLVSLKATILALATKILTNINFTSALQTTNKTITGAINEVAQGGGGGGGAGHTIKNDSGNALTQRSNLQFKGVYSHDDSTNSASVVEIARQMTRAQYNLLSEDEKKGLIQIIDEFDADIMFVNGVFIDTDNVIQTLTTFTGETTYTATEDCVVIGSVSTKGGSSAYVRINGVDVLTHYSQNGEQSIYQTFYLKKGQTILFHNETNWANINGYVVYGIQEGTNPSIPDYSTTEHKTGRKWIDGKDIWEITYTVATLPNTATMDIAAPIDMDLLLDIKGRASASNGNQLAFPYTSTETSPAIVDVFFTIKNNIKYIEIVTNFNATSFGGHLTIQYTKAS